MPMVPAIQALCIFGVTRSIAATMGSIFYGVGKPKIQTKLAIIQLIILAVIIYPLTVRWNILGTSLAIIIPMIVILILGVREVKNILAFEYKTFLGIIGILIAAVFLMILSLSLAKMLLLSGENVANFLLLVLLGGIIYSGTMYLWGKVSGHKMGDIISEILNAQRYQ